MPFAGLRLRKGAHGVTVPSMLQGDPLAVQLFLGGTAITVLGVAMTQAGWTHRWFVGTMFVLGAVLFGIAIGWGYIEPRVPLVADIIGAVVATRIAWFCAGVVLGIVSSMVLASRRKPDNTIRFAVLSDTDRAYVGALVDLISGQLSDTYTRLLGIFYSINNTDSGGSGDSAFFVMESIKNGLQQNFSLIDMMAKQPLATLSVNVFMGAIVSCFRSYRAAQDYIPKFVTITNVNPNRSGHIAGWLDSDKELLAAIRKLRREFPKHAADLAEQFTASRSGFDAKGLDALIVVVPLPPVSDRDREIAEQRKPQSGVSLTILDRIFDPNGPTEMYLDCRLKNPGIPTTVKNWKLSVHDHSEVMLANYPPRLVMIGKLVPGAFGSPVREDLTTQPLEQGGERTGRLCFTFRRIVATDQFGAKGLRFRVTAEDIGGNQLEASYTAE
jgi:hypothetical protein